MLTTSPKIILCVDDDQDDCLWIREAIHEADPSLHVVSNNNGQEAMDTLHRLAESGNQPCLILLDINMPVMDGKQTLAAIRQNPQFANIPVVILTTSSSSMDQLFCARYGVGMVTKPHALAQMKAVVKDLVASCVSL